MMINFDPLSIIIFKISPLIFLLKIIYICSPTMIGLIKYEPAINHREICQFGKNPSIIVADVAVFR